MAKQKKKLAFSYTDIYLFVLARRMIEFEITDSLGQEPSGVEVAEHIRNHFPEDDPVERNLIKRFFERHLWKDKPEDIGERELNWMIKLITKLDRFKNWNEFKERYQYSIHLSVATMMDGDYDLKKIRHETNAQLTHLYYARLQEGRLTNIFDRKFPFLINQLAYSDITVILRVHKITKSLLEVYYMFYKNLLPAPFHSMEEMEIWYDKNPNIFYGCLKSGVMWSGIMTVLPITEEAYLGLRSGKRAKLSIGPRDIIEPEDKIKTKCLFIEAFMCYQNICIIHFRDVFFKIVDYLADLHNPDVIICAISCTPETDILLMKYGFKQRSIGARIDNASKYLHTLFETTSEQLARLIIPQSRIVELKENDVNIEELNKGNAT